MCLLAGTLRIELRPSDLESLALAVTLYPEVSKTPRPWAWSFKNVALKIAARVFLTFYIYYIIEIIKSQNKMEQIVGFEPTPRAWQAHVLTTNTIPAFYI